MQFGHPPAREDRRALVRAVGEMSHQVVGHILGTGDEKGRRQLIRQIGQSSGKWNPKPPAVARCQAMRCGISQRDETVVHLQGREDVLLNIGTVRLTRDDLDEEPQDEVVGVGVLKGCANRLCEDDRAQFTHALFQAGLPCSCHGLLSCSRRQATGLVQQMVDPHLGRRVSIRYAEPRQIALNRCIQLHLASINQLHNGQSGKRFTQ